VPVPQETRIALRAPIIVLILAATAVPIEWRPPGQTSFDFGIDLSAHFWVNVIGYLPLGFVLADIGILRALAVGAAMSVFIEIGQMAMLYRDPSLSDIVANTLGALFGVALAHRCRIRTVELPVERYIGFAAAAFACGIMLWKWADSGGPVNPRGWTSPGILEARWAFDNDQGALVRDSSGGNLDARFSSAPAHTQGVIARAAVFDGSRYVEVGSATALRLAGSMTITAMINSAAFPGDDAAIVSQLSHGLGYQLDTTVDKGPRTIGFKLTNTRGQLMIRYGRTPLVLNTWYHIAGVYDAQAKTLDVYLNGRQDDGPLAGVVTGMQHPSRAAVFVGRRADAKGFEFTGFIDDVRIYSLALTQNEIEAVMRGAVVERARATSNRRSLLAAEPAPFAESYDIEIPVAAAAVGMLAALACIGIWPATSSLAAGGVSALAGLLLLAAAGSDLPLLDWISLPLTSITGGASVILSRRLERA
jgi:VanZ family protein